ncbi:MAG: tRNA (guanosine(37)-N1)-methyltransferase TrmD [Bacteroidales bacterium]|nr:tRNA (guanosine(37)-N1)-methyltransferase TrmD [Bacteroidales bacterium]
MRIDIITVLPQLLQGPFNHSIINRTVKAGLVEITIHDLREYGLGKHRQVDDYAYGGEAGMVLMIEPIFNIINKLKSEREYDAIIYTTPDAETWNQKTANHFSTLKNIIILCGHYKGIDQRVRDNLITHEFSIGDYVLTGGELAAAVLVDSIVRLLPGAISDEQSALSDSFQDDLLAPPVYTRPAEFNNWQVPEVLLSGNTAKIDKWKEEKAIERTKQIRPDLL